MTIETPQNKISVGELSVIEVTGEDSTDFLHAQFTGDCEALLENHMIVTAWCSPKGRVLHLIRLIRNENKLFMLVPTHQTAPIIKRLQMFVFRSKVVLTDCSESHSIIACHGRNSLKKIITDEVIFARFTKTQQWLIVENDKYASTWNTLKMEQMGDSFLRKHDIQYGVPQMPDVLSDQFLPQEINLEELNGLSFEKGCYPGQEIITRVKYRGKVKRVLKRFSLNSSQKIEAASKLIDESENRVGTVISSLVLSLGLQEVLAVVNIDCEKIRLEHEHAIKLTALPIATTNLKR